MDESPKTKRQIAVDKYNDYTLEQFDSILEDQLAELTDEHVKLYGQNCALTRPANYPKACQEACCPPSVDRLNQAAAATIYVCNQKLQKLERLAKATRQQLETLKQNYPDHTPKGRWSDNWVPYFMNQ